MIRNTSMYASNFVTKLVKGLQKLTKCFSKPKCYRPNSNLPLLCLTVSKMVACQLKTITLYVPWPAHTRVCCKSERDYLRRVAGRQFMMYVRLLDCLMAHVSKFYWTNWTWEDGCQVCGTIAERRSAEGTSHENLKGDTGTHYKQPRICFYGHITGNITWVYGSPSLPWLMKPCPVRSNITWILNCFFNTEGIVHKEFVPTGQTVNAKF